MPKAYSAANFYDASMARVCLYIDGGLKTMGNICGKPRMHDSVYCPAHRALCYVKKKPKDAPP